MTNPTNEPLPCAAVRESLLDHLYGALDDAEGAAVAAHLASCEACRGALAGAESQRDVLARAARVEAGDVTFAPPSGDAGGAGPHRRERPRASLWAVLRPIALTAAAAALVAAVWVPASAWSAGRAAVRDLPIVEATGPAVVTAGEPVRYAVRATAVDGAPAAVRFTARLPGEGAAWRDAATVTLDGSAAEGVLEIDPGRLAPGATIPLVIAAAPVGGGPEAERSVRFRLREGTRLVSRVATDKPLYRPGETVRVRAVALENLRLQPAGDANVRVRLFDPRGGIVADRALPTLTGVTAMEFPIPGDAPGGTWRCEVAAADGGPSLASSERTFRVRPYRVPRLRFETTFDRDSYAPGGTGSAQVRVLRAEGGAPVGAKATATLRVGETDVAEVEVLVRDDGTCVVPFTLPAVLPEGRTLLAVTVRDGGAVEATARTVPVVRDDLRVETFAEGGALVAGLPNRVYVRARTAEDEPADLDAEVRDDAGRRVATVRTDVLGMGVAEWTPEAGRAYRIVRAATGAPVAGDITLTAATAGTTLRSLADVVPAGRAVPVRIGSTRGGRHVVAAWCRGAAVGEASVDVPPGGTADVAIPIRTDAGGVVRVTVFDPAGNPAAERLVAREAVRRLDVTATPSKSVVAPRERVSVAFRVRDESGAPAQAILGASVVDASVLALADDRDTASMPIHFLLGMEVKDLEETATFADGPKAALATDRILGVQGWRRFAWKGAAGAASADDPAAAAPHSWSTAEQVRAAVRSASDAAFERSARNAAGLAILGVFLGGMWCGARGVAARRRGVAFVGFAASGLLGFLALSSAVVPRMGLRLAGAPQGDDAGDLTFAKYEERDSASLGESVLRLFGGSEDAAPATAMPPAGLALGAVTGWGPPETMPAIERVAEESALSDGEARVAALEDLRKLGYIGGGLIDGFEEIVRAGDDDDDGFLRTDEKRRQVGRLVREYAHRASAADVRDDFAEVLAWAPLLVTDKDGAARIEFDASDSVTSFRVSVDAHDGRGALGAGAAEFASRLPFYAEPKLPTDLTAGDEVDLPVVVANGGEAALDASVVVGVDGKSLALRGGAAAPAPVRVAGGARGRAVVPLVALTGRGPSRVDVTVAAGPGLRDRSTRTVEVHPRGFPLSVHRSGVLEKTDGTTFVLPRTFDRRTFRGSLRIYPSTLATLVDGLDGLLAEPHGCFEQVSSSNYPNVLALQYLEDQRAAAPEVASRARDLLSRGYAMLAAYECRRRGFEWFGADPGHEGLTAYGLMEFADMAKVHPGVDAAMVARTRDWLLARRDGEGGFRREGRGKWEFSDAPQAVYDGYVAWALSEADAATDLADELARAERVARESDDPYLVALAANALRNRGHTAAGRAVDRLASMQRPDGGFEARGTSITRSVGANLETETAALAAVAFTRSPSHLADAEESVRFLLARRQGGRFGATQATVLALRALVEHARTSRRTATDHDLTVVVNGVEMLRRRISAGTPGVVAVEAELLDALVPGENRVELRTTGGEALPWAVAIELRTERPADDPACAVTVETSLGAAEVREGGPVEARVVVRNRTREPQAMTLARLGVPAGLEPRAERLEELKRAGAIDFFEIRPREVVLYWRGLEPGAAHDVSIDLTATVPGRFEGAASSAYLYYGDDRRTWAAPLRVVVR